MTRGHKWGDGFIIGDKWDGGFDTLRAVEEPGESCRASEQTQGWRSSRLEQQLCPQAQAVLSTPGAPATPNSPPARRNHRVGSPGAAGGEGKARLKVQQHQTNGIWRWSCFCAVHSKHLTPNSSSWSLLEQET